MCIDSMYNNKGNKMNEKRMSRQELDRIRRKYVKIFKQADHALLEEVKKLNHDENFDVEVTESGMGPEFVSWTIEIRDDSIISFVELNLDENLPPKFFIGLIHSLTNKELTDTEVPEQHKKVANFLRDYMNEFARKMVED